MIKQIVDAIWHFKVKDNRDWEFCAGILKQDEGIEMSPDEVKKAFKHYFIETVKIAPYTKCPVCGEWLVPRESQYGYFVGCSTYPTCKFMASPTKPYVKSRRTNRDG